MLGEERRSIPFITIGAACLMLSSMQLSNAHDLRVFAHDQDRKGVKSKITFVDPWFQPRNWGETEPSGILDLKHTCRRGDTVKARASVERRKYAPGDSACSNPLTEIRLFKYETLRKQLRGLLVIYVPDDVAKFEQRLLNALVGAIRRLGFFENALVVPVSWSRYFEEARTRSNRSVLLFASRSVFVRAVQEGRSDLIMSLVPASGLVTDYQVVLVSRSGRIGSPSKLLSEYLENPAQFRIGGLAAARVPNQAFLTSPTIGTRIDRRRLKYSEFADVNATLGALRAGKVDAALLSTQVVSRIQLPSARFAAAVSAPRRIGLLKELPTLREGGVDSVFADWRGLFSPVETPLVKRRAYEHLIRLVRMEKAWVAFRTESAHTEFELFGNSFQWFVSSELGRVNR